MTLLTAGIQVPPLDISKALHELFEVAISGAAHLTAAKSVAQAAESHPVIMSASPLFFRLTTHAHLDAAQMSAARLFDKEDNVGIPWLLNQAKHRRKEFSFRTENELKAAIAMAEQALAAQASVLVALKCRRDKWLGHLDKNAIRDPQQFQKDAQMTRSQLEDLFDSARDILNVMSNLHGEAGFLIFGDDYDDLSHTLDLIAKGVQANAQELAQRIGRPDALAGSF
jgi:hypothetical protein